MDIVYKGICDGFVFLCVEACAVEDIKYALTETFIERHSDKRLIYEVHRTVRVVDDDMFSIKEHISEVESKVSCHFHGFEKVGYYHEELFLGDSVLQEFLERFSARTYKGNRVIALLHRTHESLNGAL